MPTSMRTCTLPSRQRGPSRGCAPSFGAASMALALLPHVGRRCAPRLSRALGSLGARQVLAASTTPSWT
eukprot:15441914-Alexandrium_andersonii.AAC.1